MRLESPARNLGSSAVGRNLHHRQFQQPRAEDRSLTTGVTTELDGSARTRPTYFQPHLAMSLQICMLTGRQLAAVVAVVVGSSASPAAADVEVASFDVVVYGGTPGGIAATVAAAREG